MLVRDDLIELVQSSPRLTNTYGLKRSANMTDLLEFARKLRSNDYDLIIDLHNSLRSRIIRLLIGARAQTVLGKRSAKRWLLIQTKAGLFRDTKPMLERYFEPAENWGIRYDGQGAEIHVSNERRKRISSLLAGLAGRPLVGLAAHASYSKKAYPLDQFAEIGRRILAETPCGLVLFGASGDPKLSLNAPGRILDLQGSADMQEAACAAGCCQIVITNDSLMLHLAEAAGADVLSLFGPTTRDFGYFPWRPGSNVFEVALACRPCSKHGRGDCSQNERYCFTRIDPSRIVQHIKDKINAGGRERRVGS